MISGQFLVDMIDDKIAEEQGTPWRPNDGTRRHLGASLIGRECLRELAYGFHWAKRVKFSGRMLRLFERGHDEEPRLVRLMELLGATVNTIDLERSDALWYYPQDDTYIIVPPGSTADPELLYNGHCVTYDPAHVQRAAIFGVKPKLKQFGFSGYKGHFGGGTDGIATGVPGLEKFGVTPHTRVGCEFKTSNDARFQKLKENGVYAEKFEHYCQMQAYMHGLDLPLYVYWCINKNDDDLYCEIVLRDTGAWLQIDSKSTLIVDAPRLPPRMMYASASNYKCKICDYHGICHMGEPMDKNCRTCTYASTADEGRWYCAKYNRLIPQDFEKEGCANYAQIT